MSEQSTYRMNITESAHTTPGLRRYKLHVTTAFGVTELLAEGTWRVVQAALTAHVEDLKFTGPQFP